VQSGCATLINQECHQAASGHRCLLPVDGEQLQPRAAPPVVAVRDGAARVLLRRETIDDLLGLDAG
jgi:diaminopimelate decarboxylase